MADSPPSVMRKKLMLIESLVINYCFSMNKMEIPDDILRLNEKTLTLEFVVCVSNMYRLLTRTETIERVEREMAKGKKINIYQLMSLLLSAGVRVRMEGRSFGRDLKTKEIEDLQGVYFLLVERKDARHL